MVKHDINDMTQFSLTPKDPAVKYFHDQVKTASSNIPVLFKQYYHILLQFNLNN